MKPIKEKLANIHLGTFLLAISMNNEEFIYCYGMNDDISSHLKYYS